MSESSASQILIHSPISCENAGPDLIGRHRCCISSKFQSDAHAGSPWIPLGRAQAFKPPGGSGGAATVENHSQSQRLCTRPPDVTHPGRQGNADGLFYCSRSNTGKETYCLSKPCTYMKRTTCSVTRCDRCFRGPAWLAVLTMLCSAQCEGFRLLCAVE